MSLESVNDILGILQKQAQWQEQPLQRLLDCWTEVVGKVVATHTRPLSIQRDVLRVATSSAAWAQNMTFGRQQLLLKLNAKLASPLVDIRFSSALWQQPVEKAKQQTILPCEHPSYLGEVSGFRPAVKSDQMNADTAFRDWAKIIQARSHHLPLCPQCQSPTPPGELQRWGVCFICAAKD
jgi:predicted nucleic acid-binding Zn ribbon protein